MHSDINFIKNRIKAKEANDVERVQNHCQRRRRFEY